MSCKHRPCRNSKCSRESANLEIWKRRNLAIRDSQSPAFPVFKSAVFLDPCDGGVEDGIGRRLLLVEIEVRLVDGELRRESVALDGFAVGGRVARVGQPESAPVGQRHQLL